ncbi:MAG TPA: hypothetical protein VFV67_30410 [Actinophytocola sp.]|uniref:hypothetical protein n=1 Tax=Actinophytocola sp. TaxID=1872138 RepID=UPI002DBD0EB8|nr:hypothetical protein [Actinophytocola sp.]HEU5474978.1 hypothetical protein [Actinophytocola sp.]
MTTPSRAFDLRLVIALLIGVYGLVLTVLGLAFTSDADIEKSAGVNVNLWAGICMVLAAAGFLLWARLRPLAVPTRDDTDTERTSG